MFSHPCCTCFARRNSNPLPSPGVPKSRTEKEEQIAAIDAEVFRTEDAIVMLVKQRAFLKRKRNAFSPAVNLPPELLSLIFEFACLPRHTDDTMLDDALDGSHIPGSMHLGLTIGAGAVTPLFIGMVCNSWRNISRRASQLWNSITVCVRNRHADAQAALLRCWLAHAGSLPLSIKLIEDEVNEEDENDGWGIDVPSTAVVNVLAEHARQWHTVDMFLPDAWKPTLARVARNLTLLTRLTLHLADGSPSMKRVNVFAGAPALREVTLVGYGVTDVDLPWTQLTYLDAECFSALEAYETLRLSSNMRHCQLDQLYRGIVPFTPQPFSRRTLETFELVVDTTVGLDAFLGSLTLPRLRNFVLALPDDSEESMMKWVLPLLQRSACNLERLHLVGVTPKEDELVECLRTLPTLTTLLLLNPRAETGGKLTERILDLMNPAKKLNTKQEDLCQHREPNQRKRHARDLIRSQEWNLTCAAHGRGNVALVDSEGGLETGAPVDDYMDGPLVPKLERLVYQGPISFDPHVLVDFLQARWHGVPSPSSSDPFFPRGNFAMDSHIIDDTDEVLHSDNDRRDCESCAKKTRCTMARLCSAIFTTPTRIQFEGADAKNVQALRNDGMHLQFLVDPNADT